ncbi:MAG TPA: HlyD family secretion protein, partial [Vicinamibacteria bacterium]|nr:HlyD family secretion protein [Vicinamibacteria bacterium]
AQIDGHIMPLAARISGTVQEVHAQDNQFISAGTLLVQIDPTDYKVALARAEAELAGATAGAQGARTNVPLTSTNATGDVETADSDVASAAARLRMAQARVKETEAKATKAAQDLERMKTLVAKDEVSRQEYDAAVSAADAARAEHEGAVAQGRDAEAGVRGAQAKRTQAATGPEQVAIMRSKAAGAEAQVAQARAMVERARLDLEHTSVKAPVSGVVSKKTVEPGQVVQPGQPLMAIVPLDDIWVTANFKEGELRDIRPGQPVTIKVDAYGRNYKGKVDSIAAATGARFSLLPPENATGNYVKVVQRVPVKITFESGQDPDHLLRPGMSVVPTVRTK